jgi:hypothetical protein
VQLSSEYRGELTLHNWNDTRCINGSVVFNAPVLQKAAILMGRASLSLCGLFKLQSISQRMACSEQYIFQIGCDGSTMQMLLIQAKKSIKDTLSDA